MGPGTDDVQAVEQLLRDVEIDPEGSERNARLFLTNADPVVVSLAQLCIGLAKRSEGHIDLAIGWLDKSVETATAAGRAELKARPELELAWCFAASGRFEDARRLLVQGTEQLLPQYQASALNCLGFVLLQTERFAESLVAFEQGVQVARIGDQHLEHGKILANRSTLLVELGDLASAERDLQESVECFVAAGRPALAAKAQHNLGWVLTRRGRVAEALQVYAGADARGGMEMAATSTGARDRAELYMTARLFREALHSAELAKQLAESDGLQSQIPEIELLIGRSLANLGSGPKAGQAFERCASLATIQGRSTSSLVAGWCAEVAESSLSRGIGPPPVDDLGGEMHVRDIIDVAFALIFTIADPPTFVPDFVDQIIEFGPRSSDPTTQIQAMLCELAIRAHTYAVDTTTLKVELLFAAVEGYLFEVESDELRSVFVESMHIEEVLAETALAIGDPVLLIGWLERLRQFLRRDDFVRPPMPDQVRARQPEQPEEQLASQRTRAFTEFATRSSDWSKVQRHGSNAPERAPLSFEAIREQTRTQPEVLLCYSVSRSDVVVHQFADGIETTERLGSSRQIAPALEAVRIAVNMALRQPGRGSGMDRADRALDRLANIICPRRFLGSQNARVAIVANGLLASVPWQLLPGFEARRIAQFPTVSEWIGDHSQPLIPTENPVVGLVCGPGLQHGAEEVEAIAAFYRDPILLTGATATVGSVRELLEHVDVAHIVAHGNRRADSAFFSGIELTDGLLMGYDVASLQRVPQRVVLSCCDLGAANSSGLASSFGFVATLRRPPAASSEAPRRHEVAAPVLVIDDADTAKVMARVHERLCLGDGLADAIATVMMRSDERSRLSAGSFNTTGR
jgi:tetratricopeptide (TPR) repeat protein